MPQVKVAQVLESASRGDDLATARLFELVYDELRVMARRALGKESPGHSLQPTALVHEAYVQLVGQAPVDWNGRTHFKSVVAQVMRRVLVDHARKKKAAKRGGSQATLVLDETKAFAPSHGLDILALNEALIALERLDERQCDVVVRKFFGLMTVPEIAAALRVSESTVKNLWRHARAFPLGRVQGSLPSEHLAEGIEVPGRIPFTHLRPSNLTSTPAA